MTRTTQHLEPKQLKGCGGFVCHLWHTTLNTANRGFTPAYINTKAQLSEDRLPGS